VEKTGKDPRVDGGGWVSSCGVALFVREHDDGHPLLMLNGIGANTEMWGPTEERLARTSRTILVDAPGAGRSDTPLVPLTIPGISRTLWRALDELGHDRVDVVGYSLGGVVAQQMARDEPRRVRRLALVNTACGWGSVPGELPAIAAVVTPLRYYSRFWYRATHRAFGDRLDDLDTRLREHVAARRRHPPSLVGYAYQLWAAMAWSSLPWLHRLDVPTLVLAAERDQLVPPANGVQLARLLPTSRLWLLPDEGHTTLFDPESPAVALLADFFSGDRHDTSAAWTGGAAVDDDATVAAAIDAAGGAEPLRTLSALFRQLATAAAV